MIFMHGIKKVNPKMVASTTYLPSYLNIVSFANHFIFNVTKLPLGIADVQVLRKVCQEFEHLMADLTEWNCFATSPTISSFLNKFYRYKYLPDHQTIPTIPEHGFQSQTRTSKLANGFFQYLESEQNVRIQRAPCEKRFGKISVDGNFSIRVFPLLIV